MDVAVIQIGNSDDKLTQAEWSEFVADVQDMIVHSNYTIHFHGLSVGSAPWQNACWVLGFQNNLAAIIKINTLRHDLEKLVRKYHQDSIALTLGDTEFVKG
jgi:hypothetical protein